LGASEWPHASKLNIDSEQFPENPFLKSKEFVEEYLKSSTGFHLQSGDILDLFDTSDSPYEINKRIEDFLISHMDSSNDITDIIFYYVGHGDYFDRNSYFIATRHLDLNHIKTTRYDIEDVIDLLMVHAGDCRHTLIIDACFAAGAIGAYLRQDIANPAKRMNEIVQKHIPKRGSALFCASGSDTFAKTLPGSSYCMFTGALAKALDGSPEQGGSLYTLRELGRKTESIIRQQFGRSGVIPEVHTPVADEGDIADVALFPRFFDPTLGVRPQTSAINSRKGRNSYSYLKLTSFENAKPQKDEVSKSSLSKRGRRLAPFELQFWIQRIFVFSWIPMVIIAGGWIFFSNTELGSVPEELTTNSAERERRASNLLDEAIDRDVSVSFIADEYPDTDAGKQAARMIAEDEAVRKREIALARLDDLDFFESKNRVAAEAQRFDGRKKMTDQESVSGSFDDLEDLEDTYVEVETATEKQSGMTQTENLETDDIVVVLGNDTSSKPIESVRTVANANHCTSLKVGQSRSESPGWNKVKIFGENSCNFDIRIFTKCGCERQVHMHVVSGDETVTSTRSFNTVPAGDNYSFDVHVSHQSSQNAVLSCKANVWKLSAIDRKFRDYPKTDESDCSN
jgi:hypothetical protein